MRQWPRFPDVRSGPALAGIFWAALFVPIFTLLRALTDASLSKRYFLIVVPLAIIGGLAWGYAVRWFIGRGARDAR